MGQLIEIEDYREVWENGEAECLSCGSEWIATVHKDTNTDELECFRCGAINSKYERNG
jgi:transcription elongation factor Elf1